MIRTLRPVALGLLVASLALCGAALPGPAAAGESVYPTGLKIGLAPAPGLRVAEKFPGFEDKETGATVLMLEVAPPALAETAKQLGRDRLKKQGIVEQRRESFPAGSKGTLVAGRQDSALSCDGCRFREIAHDLGHGHSHEHTHGHVHDHAPVVMA